MPLIAAAEFAAGMAALGPFEPAPRLAAGVSGGADSMALAFLADGWARERGGSLLALVVDHGLRPESREEARTTLGRLAARGIAAKLLEVQGLSRGPALAERAREARFAALLQACEEAGIVHLLLGHHAADQAETVLIRALGRSGAAGMAGMAAMVELPRLRLLRPLRNFAPERLRATLDAAGVAWVEDPSNTDRSALRPRLRLLRRDSRGEGSATGTLVAAAQKAGSRRAEQERRVAAELAQKALVRPEGFALLTGAPHSPEAFTALVQMLSGAPYPPASRVVMSWAAASRPTTLGGIWLLPTARYGPGLLAVREPAAMAGPVAAWPGVVWDGRFRLGQSARPPPDTTIGPLAEDAARLRRFSRLPSVVLRTLPAIRQGGTLLAVPHLQYPDREVWETFPVLFSPPRPAGGPPFCFGDA